MDTETVPVLPQLWSSALQETHSHMNTMPIMPSPIPEDVSFMDFTKKTAPPPPTMRAVMHTMPFQCALATVAVFTASFLLLVTIRPPFTFTTSDNKHECDRFSVNKAALYALGATVLGVIITIALYISISKTAALSPP
jgi:hypothetical protein